MKKERRKEERNLWQEKEIMGFKERRRKKNTSDGTRTRNPRLRRPMPYPLGYGGR